MLFRVNSQSFSLQATHSDWSPKELELEKYLVSQSEGGTEQVLAPEVFGEPLLLLDNQVRTAKKKRADILALDRSGNAVVIELKRDRGHLGVETQALQYLADFSRYKGKAFLEKFVHHDQARMEALRGFLGADVEDEDLNRKTRIILVARSFDETIFSMGEWFSSNGVPFRCLSYTPTAIGDHKYVSFSVQFDRTPTSLYSINTTLTSRRPKYYWHNIGETTQQWWEYCIDSGVIATSFENEENDRGADILQQYIDGDTVVAYAKGYGAVGWGRVGPLSSYKLVKPGSKHDVMNGVLRHRRAVHWQHTVRSLSEAIPASKLRDLYGIYHPVATFASIDPDAAKHFLRDFAAPGSLSSEAS